MRGVRGEGGEEGEEGPLLSPTMSLDRRKRQALSMSGSAYSVESGGELVGEGGREGGRDGGREGERERERELIAVFGDYIWK